MRAARLHGLWRMQAENGAHDWLKIGTWHRACAQIYQRISKSGFEFFETIARDQKLNGFPNFALHMREIESNNCVWHDHAVFAHLAVEADVEAESAQAVITVGDADERAEHVWAFAEALKCVMHIAERMQELEFATASQALRQLARNGDAKGVRTMLDELGQRFDQHPWLKDKLARLRILAEQDAELMSKEVMFSHRKMSSRLSARHEVAYSMDETNSVMPAFLRKKAEEGRGRRQK